MRESKLQRETARRVTKGEWLEEGTRLFGPDQMKWRFVCPVCGYEASVQDWKNAGATEGEVAFSCIGRHVQGSRIAFGGKGAGPCNYAGGGLFRLNPVIVDGKHQIFEFAGAQ